MCRFAFLVMTVSALLACGDTATDEPGEGPGGPPVVYTTFYPTTYFVERLAGDFVEVVCPLPEGEDAIFWQPDDETLAAYQKADLIVINGASFEKWVLTASLPESRVVDTAALLADELVRFEDAVVHTHGPAGEHAHEGIDGHTWVDPQNARAQAATIRDALKKLLPAHSESIEANFATLAADLDGLQAELARMTESYRGETIYASHPAYNYLRKRYGWKLVNLNLDPEEMPSDDEIGGIRESLAERPARFILWESEPKAEIAARFLAELGLTSVTISPCETEPEDGLDYMEVMRRSVKALAPVLTPKDE